MSRLARVRNSWSSFQSNLCIFFSWDLAAVCIMGESVIVGCPQCELTVLYNFSGSETCLPDNLPYCALWSVYPVPLPVPVYSPNSRALLPQSDVVGFTFNQYSQTNFHLHSPLRLFNELKMFNIFEIIIQGPVGVAA